MDKIEQLKKEYQSIISFNTKNIGWGGLNKQKPINQIRLSEDDWEQIKKALIEIGAERAKRYYSIKGWIFRNIFRKPDSYFQ